MSKVDETKKILEALLANLHEQQAQSAVGKTGSYLEGGDGKFLGSITLNKFDSNSLLNKYGPYGSKYSPQSILNRYSPYGSKFGSLSINNPSCTNPPKLIIHGKVVGHVSANPRIKDRIPPEVFLALLETDPRKILDQDWDRGELSSAAQSKVPILVADDGVFLGKLNPNPYDLDSIFNEYGSYGSEYSPTSIFNEYSTYGSPYSAQSPFNEFSSTPPKILAGGQFIAYVSVNDYLTPRIEPSRLKEWAEQNVPKYG